MKVRDLIKALEQTDGELSIATFANGHLYHSAADAQSHGTLRVVVVKGNASTNDNYVIIGNYSKSLNFEYIQVIEEVGER